MIHTLVVRQFSKMLGNLVAILGEADKYAGEKKFDVAVLLVPPVPGNKRHAVVSWVTTLHPRWVV